jgi:Cd2+/Zn2+-exporting ATPase
VKEMVEHVLEKPEKAGSWKAVWEKNGGTLIAAACLVLIGLAWSLERNGYEAAAMVMFVLAYAVGGHRKAWEGLTTLIKEKDLDVDLLIGCGGNRCGKHRLRRTASSKLSITAIRIKCSRI